MNFRKYLPDMITETVPSTIPFDSLLTLIKTAVQLEAPDTILATLAEAFVNNITNSADALATWIKKTKGEIFEEDSIFAPHLKKILPQKIIYYELEYSTLFPPLRAIEVKSITFSPDKRYIAAIFRSGKFESEYLLLVFWNPDNGKIITTIPLEASELGLTKKNLPLDREYDSHNYKLTPDHSGKLLAVEYADLIIKSGAKIGKMRDGTILYLEKIRTGPSTNILILNIEDMDNITSIFKTMYNTMTGEYRIFPSNKDFNIMRKTAGDGFDIINPNKDLSTIKHIAIPLVYRLDFGILCSDSSCMICQPNPSLTNPSLNFYDLSPLKLRYIEHDIILGDRTYSFCDPLGNFHIIYRNFWWKKYDKNLYRMEAFKGGAFTCEYLEKLGEFNLAQIISDKINAQAFSTYHNAPGTIIGIYVDHKLFLLKQDKEPSVKEILQDAYEDLSCKLKEPLGDNRLVFAIDPDGLIAFENQRG